MRAAENLCLRVLVAPDLFDIQIMLAAISHGLSDCNDTEARRS
jgi:hypothetical protein